MNSNSEKGDAFWRRIGIFYISAFDVVIKFPLGAEDRVRVTRKVFLSAFRVSK
jgi:hypothetical protein